MMQILGDIVMRNLAIIPARSGSKGLPGKNIKMLCGTPMMGYSIHAAIESGLFDEVMVSTDSDEYANIALELGAKVPFLRSKECSEDNSSSWETVIEVLNRYKCMGVFFDTVCLLQPTSPLRKSSDIIEAYKLYVEKKADAVTSVCEVDHSPLWCMELPQDGSLQFFRQQIIERPRQALPIYYRLNGAIYIRSIIYKGNAITFMDDREYAYIMDKKNSVDVDDIFDFKLAELYIRKL